MDNILKILQTQAINNNRLPTRDEIRKLINDEDIKKKFRSITNLEKLIKTQFTKEELIDILREKARKIGRTPHNTEMIIPQAIVFIKEFGSWDIALYESGIGNFSDDYNQILEQKIQEHKKQLKFSPRRTKVPNKILLKRDPYKRSIPLNEEIVSVIHKSVGNDPIALNKELLILLKNELKRLKTTNILKFRRYRDKKLIPSEIFYLDHFQKSWSDLIKMIE